MALPTNAEELKAAIDAAVAKEVDGLKTKNDELLGKLGKAKETLSKIEGLDIESLISSKKELDEIKKKKDEDQGNYKKLYEDAINLHATEKDNLSKQLEETKGQITTMQKEQALMKELGKAKVKSVMMDSAVKLLINDVTMTDDGQAIIGAKPIGDFIKEWSTSDVGANFITSGNSGGGANGGAGDAKSIEMAGWFKKGEPTYNLTKQAALAKENPAEHARLLKLHGGSGQAGS